MSSAYSLRSILTLVILLACAGVTSADEQSTARDAFDRLKALEGTWHGTASGAAEAEETVTHVFEVSAAGTVVMETMNPESPDHEMWKVSYSSKGKGH